MNILVAIGFLWSCADYANYAAIVAVDRDSGVAYEQRVQTTVRAIASQVDDLALHSEEVSTLARITADVYSSRLRPVDEGRRAYRQCVRGHNSVVRSMI